MSASRINHVMTSVKQVLDEAADRFNFTTPYQNIKRMRIKKTDVTPFTIEEVEMIIKYCREDFRDYFTVKFFTGMRPGEIHGLKWKYIDFEKRLITIRETNGKSLAKSRPMYLPTATVGRLPTAI